MCRNQIPETIPCDECHEEATYKDLEWGRLMTEYDEIMFAVFVCPKGHETSKPTKDFS